jgi:hypothetical protein
MVLEDIFCLKYGNLQAKDPINFLCQAHFIFQKKVIDLIDTEEFCCF